MPGEPHCLHAELPRNTKSWFLVVPSVMETKHDTILTSPCCFALVLEAALTEPCL